MIGPESVIQHSAPSNFCHDCQDDDDDDDNDLSLSNSNHRSSMIDDDDKN